MDYSIMYPHCHSSASGSSPSSSLALTREQQLQPQMAPIPSSSTTLPDHRHQHRPTTSHQLPSMPLKRSHTNPLQSLETRLSALLWACDEGTHGGALDRSTSTGECYWSGNAGLKGNAGSVGMDRSGSAGLSSSPQANSPYTSLSSSSSSTLDAPCPPPLSHSFTSPASLPTTSTILDQMGMGSTVSKKDRALSFGGQLKSGSGGARTVKGFETIAEGGVVGTSGGVGMVRAATVDVVRTRERSRERGKFNPSVDARLLGI